MILSSSEGTNGYNVGDVLEWHWDRVRKKEQGQIGITSHNKHMY